MDKLLSRPEGDTRWRVRLERALSIVLVVSIFGFSAVLVFDRFLAQRIAKAEPDPPVYVAEWREFRSSGVTLGNLDAQFQLVEFVDLQCPACRRFHRDLLALKQELGPTLSVTYIHVPLDYHPTARRASHSLICANDQGAGERFVDSAFARQPLLRAVGDAEWMAVASSAGISDTGRFRACLADSSRNAMIDEGVALAKRAKIEGTPTIVLNGWRFAGALPTHRFLSRFVKELIDGRHPPPGNGLGASRP